MHCPDSIRRLTSFVLAMLHFDTIHMQQYLAPQLIMASLILKMQQIKYQFLQFLNQRLMLSE